VVDTLKYLKMGGRLSSSAAVLGGMLHIKPLVSIVDGEVKSVGKERGQKAAFSSILKQMKQNPPDKGYTIVLGHSNAPDLMQGFIDVLSADISLEPKVVCDIGAVIGTHAGPGCVGLAYIPQ
jgi:DegV family protein with EDD domain